MNIGNVVRLPGRASKCLFEVSGHEFKARPVSMAVDSSPASSAIGGRAGFNQGCSCIGGVMEGEYPTAEGVSKGVTMRNCEEGREDIKEWGPRERRWD